MTKGHDKGQMSDRETLKLALEALENMNPYPASKEYLRNDAIAALRQALEQPDMGIDRGAWSDVPDATEWVDELRGDEEQPNSTTDVVEPTDSLSTLLWRDLKTDRQRADWLRLGMGYQTGVIAAAIQQELAMAYERLVGFQKIHAALEQQEQEPVAYRVWDRMGGISFRRKKPDESEYVEWDALYTAPPKPAQDLIVGYADVHDLTRDGHDFWVSRQPGKNTVPLYLYGHPPKIWQGLTEEEALALVAYSHPLMNKLSVARALEAKLKEKNNG